VSFIVVVFAALRRALLHRLYPSTTLFRSVLLWRANRASLVVIGAGVTLLALSTAARMIPDSVTFISVVGTVLSLLALVVMGYLMTSRDVREHVREGVPLRLR